MKITVLGCGSSGGVPLTGMEWGDCDATEPRNHRRRVSILVEQGETRVLVDTSPDMRAQLIDANVKSLSAVLYTHAHADHCHGIDDLRSLQWGKAEPMKCFADPVTAADISGRFSYIFRQDNAEGYYKPFAEMHIINGPFRVGELDILPFTQNHGSTDSLGFRFGDFAYSTDAHKLDDKAFEALEGIKFWVVDCVGHKPHPTHSHLLQTLEWIERVKPERAYLTHMATKMDYAKLCAELPPHIRPAHDGLVIEC